MTGVLKLNPLTNKATSSHSGGHICLPLASEQVTCWAQGDMWVWAVRVRWVNRKVLFYAPAEDSTASSKNISNYFVFDLLRQEAQSRAAKKQYEHSLFLHASA